MKLYCFSEVIYQNNSNCEMTYSIRDNFWKTVWNVPVNLPFAEE